ncbi:hypothetical protein [Enterocloster sp.]|uniref:hypothetical protein n=1 Tax=Enterocloster sp. TaxID=2719315 RepID=UPI0039A1AE73
MRYALSAPGTGRPDYVLLLNRKIGPKEHALGFYRRKERAKEVLQAILKEQSNYISCTGGTDLVTGRHQPVFVAIPPRPMSCRRMNKRTKGWRKETSMYTVSNHAKERYAERCKDRDSRLEITAYVAEHSQRIEEEINRCCVTGNGSIRAGRRGKDRYPRRYRNLPVDTAGQCREPQRHHPVPRDLAAAGPGQTVWNGWSSAWRKPRTPGGDKA